MWYLPSDVSTMSSDDATAPLATGPATVVTDGLHALDHVRAEPIRSVTWRSIEGGTDRALGFFLGGNRTASQAPPNPGAMVAPGSFSASRERRRRRASSRTLHARRRCAL